ncbi:alpha/beta hydrolase family protein [Sphingobacterium populi]|uniref:Alpha/beta hydrolase family protein n=2 Tax=Sphingobacterium TaxID=28453 RepID=A0ABW5UBV5_9SPHI
MNKSSLLSLLLLASVVFQSQGQENLTYQKPPTEILELLEAKNTPAVQFNRQGDKMLLLERPDFITIEDAAQPIIGLAGLRVNPSNSTSIGGVSYAGIQVQDLKSNEVHEIGGLPINPRISNLQFNADETKLAFLNATTDGVSLWVIDLAKYQAQRVGDFFVNDIMGASAFWKDNTSLYVLRIPDRGAAPSASLTPTGPVVQENLGKAAPSRTYQNLLRNESDVRLFDYYLNAQLAEVQLDGQVKDIAAPAIYRNVSKSPDGKYLMATTIKKPYSYLVSVASFPYQIDILDQSGAVVKALYTAPLAESVPLGFDSTVPGYRNFAWRADQPATVYWANALDEGNSRTEVPFRDEVLQLAAPFTGVSTQFAKTTLRYAGITWFDKDYAVLSERWRANRRVKNSLISSKDGQEIKVIEERSSEDAYADPGRFVLADNDYHRAVILTDKGKSPTVFTTSDGASPEGDRPFLLKWNLMNGQKDTLFRSRGEWYESPVYFKNDGTLIISRESQTEVPNYQRVALKSRKMTPITRFTNPYPSFEGVQKQQLSYPRKDGLSLTGTLYLPKGYQKSDGPLPLLMWAYPREFKTADAASQVKGSPYRFTRISWGSPIYWVNRGYAILDNADMPIVGEGTAEPNDTFVPQLQANAEAAINYLSEAGYVDRQRVGVGGHSYGAFMTANLLAHTDLFAAGLARSGAYNRTFTPFGFQAEERTYWQAPEVYKTMSPFSYADKIKTPILFIHGMDDENSGTFPIQSERFYNAIKGHGGTARLVFLPKEFHGYRAKESIMHTLWEMDQWLEKYVKNKK